MMRPNFTRQDAYDFVQWMHTVAPQTLEYWMRLFNNRPDAAGCICHGDGLFGMQCPAHPNGPDAGPREQAPQAEEGPKSE